MDDNIEKSGQDLSSPLVYPSLVYNFNVLFVCSIETVTSLVA